VAVVSTAAVAVPPAAYGGTEQVVYDLTAGLVQAGHEVTLFATGDSRTPATLRALYPRAVWPVDPMTEVNHAAWACAEIACGRWDVVHAHQPVAVPLSRLLPAPLVYTIHHDRQERYSTLYRAHPEVQYVAISARQRDLETPLPHVSVIHHGIDPARFPFVARPAEYVAFIGRFAPVKAPHLAIEAARRAGVPIRLAGRPHAGEGESYHGTEILPRLRPPDVEWVGEVGGADKAAFLGKARAMLLPLCWEEPFGLVTVEAMLCGTPVIAFRRGAACEIVDDGVTGFLVRDTDEMAEAIAPAVALDRARCRARALARFGAERMVADYLGLYDEVRARAAHLSPMATKVRTTRRAGGSADKRRRRGRQGQPRR
jgi:glycosyltransferase involved in cell wall biosynthesis